MIAYVGGLDLCWGRWDIHEHPIVEPNNSDEIYKWPGIEYSNSRINDFDKVKEYLKENVDRNKMPRMPWHDVHCRLIGPVVYDIARHFVQRWNISRGDSITDIKQSASTGQQKRGGLRVKEEDFFPRKNEDNITIKIIEEKNIKKEEDKINENDKEELEMKKKGKTVIKRKDKNSKEKNKEREEPKEVGKKGSEEEKEEKKEKEEGNEEENVIH